MQTKIKQLLSQKNISQREVAERMGISPQSLACRLKAEDISLSTLNGIADAMEIELNDKTVIFEYSVDNDQLVLTEREYGEQMILIKE